MALIMPLHTGGSLKKHVATYKLSPSVTIRLATQMARAIEHLHSHGVIHKDVALRNFVLSADGAPVLIDFGLSTRFVVRCIAPAFLSRFCLNWSMPRATSFPELFALMT